MRSEWAIELIGLRRMVSFMTSLLNNCFLGGASARAVGYSVLGAGFG